MGARHHAGTAWCPSKTASQPRWRPRRGGCGRGTGDDAAVFQEGVQVTRFVWPTHSASCRRSGWVQGAISWVLGCSASEAKKKKKASGTWWSSAGRIIRSHSSAPLLGGSSTSKVPQLATRRPYTCGVVGRTCHHAAVLAAHGHNTQHPRVGNQVGLATCEQQPLSSPSLSLSSLFLDMSLFTSMAPQPRLLANHTRTQWGGDEHHTCPLRDDQPPARGTGLRSRRAGEPGLEVGGRSVWRRRTVGSGCCWCTVIPFYEIPGCGEVLGQRVQTCTRRTGAGPSRLCIDPYPPAGRIRQGTIRLGLFTVAMGLGLACRVPQR